MVVQEKVYMKQNMRKKMMDKVVENLIWGRWIPIDSMKSKFFLKIMIIRLGVWVILSQINPIRPIWFVHAVHSWVGVIRVKWDWGEKWIHLIGTFLLIFYFITTITNKKEKNKQTNEERKRKIQKQAYTTVDPDLDDS